MILEELRSMLIWESGQQLDSLLRFRNDSETEKVIPNQFNRRTDDSFPGVCGTERIAVIAGPWQGNQAPAPSLLGCISGGPQFRDPPTETCFSELSQPSVWMLTAACLHMA